MHACIRTVISTYAHTHAGAHTQSLFPLAVLYLHAQNKLDVHRWLVLLFGIGGTIMPAIIEEYTDEELRFVVERLFVPILDREGCVGMLTTPQLTSIFNFTHINGAFAHF